MVCLVWSQLHQRRRGRIGIGFYGGATTFMATESEFSYCDSSNILGWTLQWQVYSATNQFHLQLQIAQEWHPIIGGATAFMAVESDFFFYCDLSNVLGHELFHKFTMWL